MKGAMGSKSIWIGIFIGILLLLSISVANALEDGWVNVKGAVSCNGAPVCAMVLINGQYMFSCKAGDDFGKYALDAPLDSNAEITIQAFVSGLAPFRQTTAPSGADNDIAMQPTNPENQSPAVTIETASGWSTPAGWARITGTVDLDGTPLCAMVLANGKYMFSCGANDGVFDLTVPLDGEGQITLFVFVSGLQPYKRTFKSDGSIMTGSWSGSGGFGAIDFFVEPDSTGLESITITFIEFRCGGVKLNGSIKKTGSSLTISNDILLTVFFYWILDHMIAKQSKSAVNLMIAVFLFLAPMRRILMVIFVLELGMPLLNRIAGWSWPTGNTRFLVEPRSAEPSDQLRTDGPIPIHPDTLSPFSRQSCHRLGGSRANC